MPEQDPIQRTMYLRHQQAEWDRITQLAEVIGRRLTNFQVDYGVTPEVIMVRGVKDGVPFTEMHVR